VKLGTTRAQRRLFFSLGRIRREVERDGRDGTPREGDTGRVAERLGVTERDVEEMASRVASEDVSLDAPLGEDGSASRLDLLAGGAPLSDHVVDGARIDALVRRNVTEALARLNDREPEIIEQRLLVDEPKTLGEIAAGLGLSGERVRQLEARAKEKLRRELVAWWYRAKPITVSAACRSPVPRQADHRFRAMPIAERPGRSR
jgi:RNA polymerase sigma-32 factor